MKLPQYQRQIRLLPRLQRDVEIGHFRRRADDGTYGQRWKCEAVNSVIKRKFGDAVRSRKRSWQQRELLVRGLVYNLYV